MPKKLITPSVYKNICQRLHRLDHARRANNVENLQHLLDYQMLVGWLDFAGRVKNCCRIHRSKRLEKKRGIISNEHMLQALLEDDLSAWKVAVPLDLL